MSGFEVVGVVLGSLPLLVSGLKRSVEGIRTMKIMRDYEGIIQDLYISLSTEYSIYRNSCESLLIPLMLPDEKLNELLSDLQGNAWEDHELCEQLCKRLGSSYGPYKSAVKQLSKRVDLFRRKLGLDSDMMIENNKTIQNDLRWKIFLKPMKRIKIGFSADNIAKCLAEIERNIDQIDRLTKSSVALEEPRLDRKQCENAFGWLKVRDQAIRVFENLKLRWSSATCPCQYPHNAKLRLDTQEVFSEVEGVKFEVLFSFDVDLVRAASVPWRWRDVEIKCIKSPSVQATLSTSNSPARKNSVFKSAITTPSPSVVQRSSARPSLDVLKIQNLCHILSQMPKMKGCLGFLEDQHWQHHIYSATHLISEHETRKSVPINEFLNQENQDGIDVRNKYTMAYTLSLGLLQLHSTPWLDENWSLDDIYLVPGAEGMPSVKRAYVSKSFKPQLQQLKRLLPRPYLDNEPIFALGVALLELSFGKPLISFKTPGDLDSEGNETQFTQYMIAKRLIEKIDGKEVHPYVTAVKKCIRCNFNMDTASLENEKFQQLFYDDVIDPLKKLYLIATGQKQP